MVFVYTAMGVLCVEHANVLELCYIELLSGDHGCVSYTPLPSPGLRMQLQVGLISCAAVTRGKKPLPLLVEYIESR